jgi:hypothetical protein
LGIIEPCLPSPAKALPLGPGWPRKIEHDGFRILARLARCLIDGEAIVCDETVDPPSWRDRQRHAAQVAGDGFAASGGALDILRSSAAQGTIAKAVTGYQGLITEAG